LTELLTTESAIAQLTLSALEIVLGIDNIVFISILVAKLPVERQAAARRIGLLLAMGMRIALLLAISWVMGLTRTLFSLMDHGFTGRDLILLFGGLFLVGKATFEIHDKLEGPEHENAAPKAAGFGAILVKIKLHEIVFSLDTVITADGNAKHIEIMNAAVVNSEIVIMIFAARKSAFIEKHPTMKMLALSFLMLIGVVLIADGFGQHVSKGYIYFAMSFSLFVEILNIRIRPKGGAKVRLKQSYVSAK
jgi:predicted tellurium resistance membrane protein TerC